MLQILFEISPSGNIKKSIDVTLELAKNYTIVSSIT